MHLPIKAVCKLTEIRRDNTAIIGIQYCFSSKVRVKLDSGLSINSKFWNSKKCCISDTLPWSLGDFNELNKQLNGELRKAEDIISLAFQRNENPAEFFKKYYKSDQSIEFVTNEIDANKRLERLNDITFNKNIYFQIDDYIKVKTRKVSADMPRIYRNMKDHLQAFETFCKKPISFEILNLNFYEEFVDYLTYDYVIARRKNNPVGLKTNTVGKTINQFKTFLKDRIKKGLISAINMDDWIVDDIKGEIWKTIPSLENYFMVSSLGRIKRLEYEMIYRNGAIYLKEEKIIKPSIVVHKNNFKKDTTKFLVNRVVLQGIKYKLTISRIVYYCFITPFNLDDNTILILCKNGDGLNIYPENLVKSTFSDRAKRVVEKGRMESTFKNLPEEFKAKQRNSIIKKISKTVTQYSIKGIKIKTFGSAADAEKGSGVFATSIGQRASRKGISAGGYVWRWGEKNVVDIESFKIVRQIQNRILNGKKVTQYDLKGNVIARFNSLQDAQNVSGANGNAIRLVLKGEYKSAKGFLWVDGHGNDIIDLSKHKWGKQSMAETQSKKIKQRSLEGTLVSKFPSVKEAALSINVTASVIVDVCKGRQKTSGGFRWEYNFN